MLLSWFIKGPQQLLSNFNGYIPSHAITWHVGQTSKVEKEMEILTTYGMYVGEEDNISLSVKGKPCMK